MKTGDKVICIDIKGLLTWRTDEIIPQKDIVYTIRNFDGGGGVRLEEIINQPRLYCDGFDECSFKISRFVPIQEKFEKITYSKVIEMVEIGIN